jgi:hypothetical protein
MISLPRITVVVPVSDSDRERTEEDVEEGTWR